MSQKTYVPSEDEIERRWVVFNASGIVLGRLATRVARTLRGKHKPEFTPHLDCGDGAIVTNASEVQLTGKKESQKKHRKHSQYPGGLREVPYSDLLEDDPETAVQEAVKGMLPSNRLGRKLLGHLRVYPGPEHPHQAQNPVIYDWEQDSIPAQEGT